MKFYAQLTLDKKIVPLYDSDSDQVRKLKQNTEYRFEVVQERNWKFHRKVMALFNLGFENQEKINSFDNYRKIMTMKAGYFTTEVTDKGIAYFPDSISYANMDQLEFEKLFDRLLDVVSKALDSKPDEIRLQVHDFY